MPIEQLFLDDPIPLLRLSLLIPHVTIGLWVFDACQCDVICMASFLRAPIDRQSLSFVSQFVSLTELRTGS